MSYHSIQSGYIEDPDYEYESKSLQMKAEKKGKQFLAWFNHRTSKNNGRKAMEENNPLETI